MRTMLLAFVMAVASLTPLTAHADDKPIRMPSFEDLMGNLLEDQSRSLLPYPPTGAMMKMLDEDEMRDEIAYSAFGCVYRSYGSGGYSASGGLDDEILYCPVNGDRARMVPSTAEVAVVDSPEEGLVNFTRKCGEKRNSYVNTFGASFDQTCHEHGYRREISFALHYEGEEL